MMLLAISLGTWLFHMQDQLHMQDQFQETSRDHASDWSVAEAALQGSSHYILPPVATWITANIGVYGVHHLARRIPPYRLPDSLLDHGGLAGTRRLSLRESLLCATLALWDERRRTLVSFGEARGMLR